MTEIARYDGPHAEVAVYDPEAPIGSGPIDTVKQGGRLKKDAPRRIHEELIQRDNWTGVKDGSSSSSSSSSSSHTTNEAQSASEE